VNTPSMWRKSIASYWLRTRFFCKIVEGKWLFR
jgi:hypothetical protein